MLITNSNSRESGLRKRTIGQELKIGPLSIQFIVIIILAAMALLYLAQSTQGATKNYKLQELKDQKEKLEADTARMEVEAARLKSLNEVQKNSESLGLTQGE